MTFYRIILPISQPGIISAALLSSVYVWNDFLVSFTFTTKEGLRMISIGLYNYITQYGIQWGELMAGGYYINNSDNYFVYNFAKKGL